MPALQLFFKQTFQTRPNHKGSILEVTSLVFTEETFALVQLGLPVSNGKRAHKQRKPLSDIPLKLEKFRDKKTLSLKTYGKTLW